MVSVSGVLGRGQNSGFVVHSATKDGETFAVKVSTECDEETVLSKLGTGEGSYLNKTEMKDWNQKNVSYGITSDNHVFHIYIYVFLELHGIFKKSQIEE